VSRLHDRAKRALDGTTALMYAAADGRADVLAALLETDAADVNKANVVGFTVLHAAVRYPDCVKLLIAKGANVNAEAVILSRTPLIDAAGVGNAETVKLLLDAGAKPNARTTLKQTALLRAAEAKHDDVVKLLLDAGADPSLAKKDGWTPLMMVARNGDEAVARLLLDHKADVNQKSDDGLTALMLAAGNGYPSIVRLLLSRGAEVQPRAGLDTPLHHATGSGEAQCVELLLKAGADPKAKDNEGKTAFDRAAESGNFAAMRVLLDAQKRH